MIRSALIALVAVWASALTAEQVYEAPQQITPGSCNESGANWAENALQRSLNAPLGLPPVPHPVDNPPTVEKIELGRKLFFDRRLSINRTMSCAMCHVPEQAFVNWELATAVGVEGRSVKRNSPTVINVAYLDALFHDGRDFSLETQYIAPMVASNEMANPSMGWVVSQINRDAEYQAMFDAAFAAPASLNSIGQALGTYQRSLVAGNSKFDRWYYGGDETALGAAEQRGFELFKGEAGCASCHLIGEESALFTDTQFYDIGYGRLREDIRQNPPKTVPVQVAPGVVHQVDFARVKSVSATREADLGRYEVTEETEDRWKFRTPSLRNVGVTPPYMHDGAFSTLSDVLNFYNTGGPNHPEQDSRIRPLGLGDAELAELEAFLNALTSTGLDCLVAEARSQPPDNH